MSYAKVLCVGLVGVAGHLVEVEADLAAGLPAVVISGLPDTALHEARDRVRAAVVNSGQQLAQPPDHRQPAARPRCPSTARPSTWPSPPPSSPAPGSCRWLALDGVVVLGELGLDGTRPPGPRGAADGGRGGPRRHRAGGRARSPTPPRRR